MIIFVLLLPVLLGFVALSIDVGLIYLTRTRMQLAADAGALAGSAEIDPAVAETVASQYAMRNGARRTITTVNNGVVEIRAEQTIGVLFLDLIGKGPVTIGAYACARSQRLVACP